MDLKDLLLGLRSSEGRMRCVRRFANYKITFEIKERVLQIRKVKHIISKANPKNRVSRRKKLLFKGCSRIYEDFYIQEQNVSTQTEETERANRSTSCDPELQIQMVCAEQKHHAETIEKQMKRANRPTRCDPEFKIQMVCAERKKYADL